MGKSSINVRISEMSGTVYVNNAKTFVKLADEYEYSECGVAFVNKDQEERLVPFESPQQAVDGYKKVVGMIELEEVQKLKMGKNLIKKIKEDIIKPQPSFYATALAFWLLFGENDIKYFTYLITIMILGSVNIVEACRLMKKMLSKPEDRAQLEKELSDFGLMSYTSFCNSEKDVSLYLKQSDGLFVRK